VAVAASQVRSAADAEINQGRRAGNSPRSSRLQKHLHR
jgi:hypothetical protein